MRIAGSGRVAMPEHGVQVVVHRWAPTGRRCGSEEQHGPDPQCRREVRDAGVPADQERCTADDLGQLSQIQIAFHPDRWVIGRVGGLRAMRNRAAELPFGGAAGDDDRVPAGT